MHDHTNADERGDHFAGGDATGASSSEAASLAAVHAESVQIEGGSDSDQNVLYGRSVGMDEAPAIMAPDKNRKRGAERPGTDLPDPDDHRPDEDESEDSKQSSAQSRNQDGRVRTRVKDEAEEGGDEEIESSEGENTQGERMDHCPECGGRIRDDAQHGEKACGECGLIIEESQIDHGPEWRSFNQEEENQRKRVGSPSTMLQHDKGLSTQIGAGNKDAYGRTLSPEQRRKMSRLRKWNERFRTRDSDDRNLKKANTNIQRIISELEIPKAVGEAASALYRRCLREDLIRGRAIESMSEAAVFIACRKNDIPRTLDELAEVSRVERQRIARSQRYISLELGLEITPPNPVKYIPNIGSGVEASTAVRELAREMVNELVESGGHSGKHPAGIAASAIYAADEQITGGELTQKELADVADITEVTIRNRKEDLIDVTEPETVERYRVQYEDEQESQLTAIESDDGPEVTESGDTGVDESETVEAESASGGDSAETESGTGAVSRSSITVDFDDEDRTQSEVMLDGVREMVAEHGLLEDIGDGEFRAPRCQNPLIAPKESADEQDFGTWHSLSDGMYVNTKLNTEDKKRRLRQLGDECDVEVQVVD